MTETFTERALAAATDAPDFDASLRSLRELRRPRRPETQAKPTEKPDHHPNARRREAEHLHGALERGVADLGRFHLGVVGHIVRQAHDLAGSEAWPTHEPTDPDREHSVVITPHDGQLRDRHTNEAIAPEDLDPLQHNPTTDAAAALRSASAVAAAKAVRLRGHLDDLVSLLAVIRLEVADATAHIPLDQLRPWCRTCTKPVATDANEKLIDGQCRKCFDRGRKR